MSSRKISALRIGIVHSIIGKNDGVSIVIDQSVRAMIAHMGVPLGNIYFLCALSPSRFHVTTDEIFWHKNEINKMVVRYYEKTPPEHFESLIWDNARYAKEKIGEFVKQNKIDLLIVHNTSHPYNFITAMGLGLFYEEHRPGKRKPKLIVWWHDSHWERPKFKAPNRVVSRFLKYLPGAYMDGLIFINSRQEAFARDYLTELGVKKIDRFFKNRARVIPNTFEADWKWKKADWGAGKIVFPPQDTYNQHFFRDIGLCSELEKTAMTMDDAVVLLQHTRIVPRKKIETAIDLTFALAEKFAASGMNKCVVLLISGHSGDEQEEYKHSLKNHFEARKSQRPELKTALILGERLILPEREIIVDKKYYRFADVPAIVAATGGIGTYFSEIEGYGNNLLEMLGAGLPVIINRYEIYRSDIEPLGFKLPYVDNGEITDKAVEKSFAMLTDIRARNAVVARNLRVLNKKLNHKRMAEGLTPLIENILR